jgi:cytochrome P450
MPTFNPRILEGFVEVFSAQAHILVQKLAKEVDKGEFDIFHYVNLCSLDTICGEKL